MGEISHFIKWSFKFYPSFDLLKNLLPIRVQRSGEASVLNRALIYVLQGTAVSSLIHPTSPEQGILSLHWLTLFLIWIAFNYVITKSSSTKIAAATYPLCDSVISCALRLCLALKS